MKAVVTVEPQRMELRDVAEPVAGPQQAIVRVEAVGLCGSDLHMFRGSDPYARFPIVQGHEFAGIVERLGGTVPRAVHVGDRVAVEPLQPCGQCYPCRRGRSNCCARLEVLGAHLPGALTERIAVRTDALYPVGDLDPELAALVEPVSIGLQAVSRGAVDADDRVVIFGAGPIGQAVLLAAVDRGARVLVADRVPHRLELARALGAEDTVDVSTRDIGDRVADWTNGDGASVVVEATGVPSVSRLAVELVAHAGRVVILGTSDDEVSLPIIAFTRKELTILGSRNNNGLFGQAVDLVQRQCARARLLITHRFPLEQTQQAIEFAMAHTAEAEKVMIRVGGPA